MANEKFGQLYWYGIEVLKIYQPKWFVAENFSGIRSAGSGDFQIILDDMRAAGYKFNVNLYKQNSMEYHKLVIELLSLAFVMIYLLSFMSQTLKCMLLAILRQEQHWQKFLIMHQTMKLES